jgi:DNA-binding SARP family transcriptional activator
MSEPLHLELQCFGAPTARVSGRAAPSQVLWPKHLALLIYLALSPHRTRTRAHLRGMLWPEKDEELAGQSLNMALTRLRAELGAERFMSSGESLSLSGSGLDVDALAFDAAVESDPQAALKVATADFLEGFHLQGAHAFEEWLAERRAYYGGRTVGALMRVGEAALATAGYSEALMAARRVLSIQPYAEPALALLMRGMALSGDAVGALAAFHEFETRAMAEIGERPSAELSALAERVRSGRWRSSWPGPDQTHLPLVGRESLHRTAFGELEEGVRNGPRLVLITGDPGTGRSRLLRECVDRLALKGAMVATARPLASDQDAPWSTLRSLLRGGILKASGSASTEPGALRLLRALVPEETDEVPVAPPREAAQVGAALSALVRAVADEQSVGLAIRDAHFSDGASLDAVSAAVAQLASSPVVVVLTATPTWEEAPHALLQLRAELGRTLPGAEIRLGPFSEDETRRLVSGHSRWCASDADRDRLARRIFFETGGNPFLVATLLRALADPSNLRAEVLEWPPPGQTEGSPLPISVPQMARRVFVARIARLDDPTRQVLQAASIGATAIDVELVAVLTGQPRASVEHALGVLERARLVTFVDDRYTVAAPLVAQIVVAEWLLPGQRRILRERALAALAGRTDIESRVLCAQLRAAVAPGPAAFDAAMEVAQAALALGARRTVRQALAAAGRALPVEDAARRQAFAQLQESVSAP